jgi:hypothetical protein
VSAFFLLLTLIAFFLSPEFNNLHGRSMACQAGSLLIMYLGMTLIYLTGATVHITVCITTGMEFYTSWCTILFLMQFYNTFSVSLYKALINYYFLLASFLWLNVMCIDIYFTFRG